MKTKKTRSDSKQNSTMDELHAIHENTQSEIGIIYKLYREEFINYAIKQFHLNHADAADIYEDSFVALQQNIRNNKLTSLSCNLKTYLFEIGKHMMMNRHRNKDKYHIEESIDNIGFYDIWDIESCYSEEWQRKQEIANQIVAAMEEPCYSVLKLYYWQDKSMAEIADFFNYKTEQVAKNRKSLCLKKLKELLVNKFIAEELY